MWIFTSLQTLAVMLDMIAQAIFNNSFFLKYIACKLFITTG